MNASSPAATQVAGATTHAPEYIRRIAPYVAGKPIDELARELGLDPSTIVKLASNENPRGASPMVARAVAAAMAEVTRYPDSNGFALKDALSKRFGVAPEGIVLGNGSNDVLELVSLAFLRPGDDAVYSQYAFIVYPLAVQARGARGIEVKARDYAHDYDAMLAAITPATRIVFVANPNNPTGTWVPPGALERFVAAVPRDVLVVLDEAYNEYLDPRDDAQSARWVSRHPNLVVSRTFSKAFGLAALRVGFALASPAVADLVNRVRPPFNVNALGQAAAVAALADERYVADSRALNDEGMRTLTEAFTRLGLRHVPSHGNFVMVEVGDAADAGLFRGRRVVLTPTAETDPAAVAAVEAMWRDAGACVSRLGADLHDRVFAAVSHLPHLLAFALVDSIARRADGAALLDHAGAGFRDFTRIAASSPEMWRDIALSNREALLAELDACAAALAALRGSLARGDGAALEAVFARAREARRALGDAAPLQDDA